MNYTLRYSFDLEDIYMVNIEAQDMGDATSVAFIYIFKEHAMLNVKALSLVEVAPT